MRLLVAYWGLRFGVLAVHISGRTREKVSAAAGQDAPRRNRKIGDGGCEEKVIFGVITCSWSIHAGEAHVDGSCGSVYSAKAGTGFAARLRAT
jgi:hypothetical protein